MLSKKNRLRNKEHITTLLKKGNVYRGRYFAIRYAPSSESNARFVCLIGRRLDKRAAARNKLRRRLTESVRSELGQLTKNIDAVIIPQVAAQKAEFLDLKQAIAEFFKSIA